jgi:ribosomal protein S18 acetylase RimI-like enzyme
VAYAPRSCVDWSNPAVGVTFNGMRRRVVWGNAWLLLTSRPSREGACESKHAASEGADGPRIAGDSIAAAGGYPPHSDTWRRSARRGPRRSVVETDGRRGRHSDETDVVDVTVRRVRADEGPVLKAVRLAALLDSPSAFASSHAAEVDQPDEHWASRASLGASGELGVTYFAIVEQSIVGMVSAYRPDPVGSSIELVSMWVSPSHRGAGIAADLVRSVVGWANETGAATVDLWVTRGNDAAMRLYEAAGFRPTGEHQPLPSDPCKDELRMRWAPG